MGANAFRLTVSRYVRPGTYIGYVRVPSPVAISGNPRYPCVVGEGSRFSRVSNFGIRRAFVPTEDLTFSTAPPYIANLDHNALDDQTRPTQLLKSGVYLSPSKWRFKEGVTGSGNFDQVEVSITTFDKNAVYEIAYQSVDPDVLDELPFDPLEMLLVGDSEAQDKYEEYQDYRIVTVLIGNPTDADAVVADSDNKYTTGELANYVNTLTGLGLAAFTAGIAYVFPYTRKYTLTCVDAGGAVGQYWASWELDVIAQNGGNSQTADIPYNTTAARPRLVVGEPAATSVDLNTSNVVDTTLFPPAATGYDLNFPKPAYMVDDGIKLDFDFSGGNFIITDKIEWDAYGPGLIEFAPQHLNNNQWSEVDEPVEKPGATGSGLIELHSDTNYTNAWNREYILQMSAASGAAYPNRTATLLWTGFGEFPFTEGSISIAENTPGTYTRVELEHGIYLNFEFGIEHAVADSVNLITAANASSLVTALLLANDSRTQYLAHDADPGPTWHYAVGGSHQVTAPVATDVVTLLALCIDLQTMHNEHIVDSGVLPADMHRGSDIFTLQDITIADEASARLFLNDFKIKFGRHQASVNFVVGDYWTVDAMAPRLEFLGKDDRDYTLQVTSVVPATSMNGSYYTSTFDGGWGDVVIDDFTAPYFLFPDQLMLAVRNLALSPRYDAGDEFTWSTANEAQIDWMLKYRSTQTISNDNIRFDQLGNITGTALTYYILLDETPSEIIRVLDADTGLPLTYSWVTGTPTIAFPSKPTGDVAVTYFWKGAEPAPGQVYYITANRIRPDEQYERPFLYLTRDQMEDALSPKAPDNYLWVAGDIAFNTQFFGGYFCQVKSASGDDIYTIVDYRRAIDATETVTDITDLIVVNYFDALGYAKASVEAMNDPFEAKERLLWVGAPIGTPVGNVDTPDSYVYLAKKTLQFVGDSPGRGNVILVGHPQVQYTITLEDGTATQLTLDGSFLAVFAAARTAAFPNPYDTLLGTDIAIFDFIQDWTEPEQLIIGEASILYLTDVGAGIYQWDESITVDQSAPDLNEISAMTQKQYVTRVLRSRMNSALKGIVPPSSSAGIIRIQSFIVEVLDAIVSSAIIAPYGQETTPPTIRPIDPAGDVNVFVDDFDKRLYHFRYFYNIRYPVKRMFGVFSVDTKFWDDRSLAAA